LARIRSDKPEAYQSETLAEISLAAERTFKGMATIADDRGRLADKPAQINGELWSMRGNHTRDDLESELAEMVDVGLVCRYAGCDGKRYLHLVTWDRHQKIDRPSKSRLPRCPVHHGASDYCGLHAGPCEDRESSRDPREDLSMGKPDIGRTRAPSRVPTPAHRSCPSPRYPASSTQAPPTRRNANPRETLASPRCRILDLGPWI
jgi:hypothetical protein